MLYVFFSFPGLNKYNCDFCEFDSVDLNIKDHKLIWLSLITFRRVSELLFNLAFS